MLFRSKRAPAAPPPAPPPLRWGTARDSAGHFSSGVPDLDALLGGGFRPGSFAAIEGEDSAYGEDFLLVALPAILNHLSLGRGAVVVPPAGIPSIRIRERAVRSIPAEVFDARVRIVDYSAVEAAGPWMLPMARFGRDQAMRAMLEAESAVRGPKPGSPFLEVSALDTLENLHGGDRAIRMLSAGIPRTKQVGNVGLLWVRSGSPSRAAATSLVDEYLVLARRAAEVTIRGVRPTFPERSIHWTESGGISHVALGLPH